MQKNKGKEPKGVWITLWINYDKNVKKRILCKKKDNLATFCCPFFEKYFIFINLINNFVKKLRIMLIMWITLYTNVDNYNTEK